MSWRYALATRHRTPNPVVRKEWRGDLPDYIHFLHNSAVHEGSADNYPQPHVAEFKITDTDRQMAPEMKEHVTIYLVYDDGRLHGKV